MCRNALGTNTYLHLAVMSERNDIVRRLTDEDKVGFNTRIFVEIDQIDAVAVLFANGRCYINSLPVQKSLFLASAAA